MTVRIGTRGSQLATTQTGLVADALTATSGLPHEIVHIRSHGDDNRASLASLGGVGVFAAALRIALLDGEVDVAVHSLKDLPTAPTPGLRVHAVPGREDVRDALCARDGLTLATLPPGARVGTGSPRRIAQLRAARPDLEIVDLRGNVPTRLGRVTSGDLDAVVLAASGIARLGLQDAVTEYLDPAVVLPAPGQGALAVEGRADVDGALAAALAGLDVLDARLTVTAERAVLAEMNAGCATPVGALAGVTTAEDGARTLVLDARSVDVDGSRRVDAHEEIALATAPQADPAADLAAAAEAGRRAGRTLLAGGAAAFEGDATARDELLDAGGADDVTGDGAAGAEGVGAR